MIHYKQKQTSYRAFASFSALYMLLLILPFSAGFISQPRASYGATTSAAGIIVPLYSYPTDDSWDMMIKLKKTYPAVQTIAIINPSDGPGSSKDFRYIAGIHKLRSAGVTVIGYVMTGYSSASLNAVKAEISRYNSWYSLDGIFFDEMSSSKGDESYYRSLSNYAKSLGLLHTVGNPGTDVPSSYIGTVDNIIIYEDSGLPSLSYLDGWHSSYDKMNFSTISYDVDNLDISYISKVTRYVGYLYVTDDKLPNPWNSLPQYYGKLVSAVNRADGFTLSPIIPKLTSGFYTVTAISTDLNGNSFSGMWTVISKDGTPIKTGYTPLSFSVQSGIDYQVTIANYKNYVFRHWEDDSISNSRTINVNDDKTITAYYSTSDKQVTLAVKSVSLSGNSIKGLWVEIYSSNGSLLKTGYTPLSYIVNTGESYNVIMGEWKHYVFDHWDNGSTDISRKITLSQDKTLTAYYQQ